MELLASLQQIPALQQVPASQLQWLLDHSDIVEYQENDYIFKPGSPVEYLYIVLEGSVQIYIVQNNQKREIFFQEFGAITGHLPYSRMKTAAANAIAYEKTTLLCFSKKHFQAMIAQHYELTEAFVHQMNNRIRDFTRQEQLNEKMISLGRLSAGLAHELNNPAAAVVRSADALQKNLRNTPSKFKKVISIQVQEPVVDAINQILFDKIENIDHLPRLTLVQRNNLEQEILDWLEDHQVEEPYEVSEILIDYGFGIEDLEKVLSLVTLKHVDPVLHWIANNLITEKIVKEIAEASERIGKIVKSVKSYTHMDKGTEKAPTNLKEGLENTLTLLNHKLKEKHIEVVWNLQDNLVPIPAFTSELNQVWTNLIDNAIDAMNDQGKLEINIYQQKEYAMIEITDNGSGIPQDIISKVFDPFFTTKPVGKGTGLGLDVTRKIIERHQGEINVTSEPGKTTFSICLPIH